MINSIVQDLLLELKIDEQCEQKLRNLVERRVKQFNQGGCKVNPNAIWEDSHIRRNVSMKSSLSKEVDDRMAEIRHIDNFSEYVRRLISMDIEHHILDNKTAAKLVNFLEDTEPLKMPFFRRKLS